jgi:hypothetical protein
VSPLPSRSARALSRRGYHIYIAADHQPWAARPCPAFDPGLPLTTQQRNKRLPAPPAAPPEPRSPQADRHGQHRPPAGRSARAPRARVSSQQAHCTSRAPGPCPGPAAPGCGPPALRRPASSGRAIPGSWHPSASRQARQGGRGMCAQQPGAWPAPPSPQLAVRSGAQRCKGPCWPAAGGCAWRWRPPRLAPGGCWPGAGAVFGAGAGAPLGLRSSYLTHRRRANAATEVW